MSIWCSVLCPECESKGNELSLARCGGWFRLSCDNCGKSWIVVVSEKTSHEIDRQLHKRLTRTEFEKDYGKGEKFLKKKSEAQS